MTHILDINLELSKYDTGEEFAEFALIIKQASH